MEETEIKEIVTEECTHIFYCDNCNKKLGESIELDDGYYEEFGVYRQSFNIKNLGSYKMNLNLCDECKKIYDKKIVDAITAIGFVEEK